MNIKSKNILITLTVMVFSYLSIQLLVNKNEQNNVSNTKKVVNELTQTVRAVETTITVDTFEQNEENEEKYKSMANSIIPSAEASTTETFEYSETDNKILGVIFNAEYEPIIDNSGALSGFRVSSIADDTLLEVSPKDKLQNGDIVTQINNVYLNNEESLSIAIAQLFQQVERAIITFGIERNGENHLISLEYQP